MTDYVVIATWPFGLEAVKAAAELLQQGKPALDAAIAGAQVVEDDPKVHSVGYAGLGNARSTPLIRDEKMHEIVASISSLKSNHNLKYGVDQRFRTSGERRGFLVSHVNQSHALVSTNRVRDSVE